MKDSSSLFVNFPRNSTKLSFSDWNKYLDEIAKNKSMETGDIRSKLVECGTPGLSGTTVKMYFFL